MPLNDSNFLMWFTASESQFTTPAPRPFVIEPEILSPVVVLYPGERYSFYINSLENVPVGGFMYMQLENEQRVNCTLTSADIEFPDGKHTYGTFTVPNVGNQGAQFVRLQFGNYYTQYLWYSPVKNLPYVARVKFRNSRRLQNLRYAYLPETFYQEFDIRLNVKGESPGTDKEVYTESVTGKTRSSYSEPRWIVTFSTPEYDRWAHRGMASMLEHDEIRINGKPYAFESAYQTNTSEGDALSTGEFSLRDEDYSTLSRA